MTARRERRHYVSDSHETHSIASIIRYSYLTYTKREGVRLSVTAHIGRARVQTSVASSTPAATKTFAFLYFPFPSSTIAFAYVKHYRWLDSHLSL